MPTVYQLPVEYQHFDSNGDPLNGGLLYTYTGGTTTAKTTYSESTGTTPHANPVVLDSAGRLSADVWGTTGSYKLVLKTSGGTTIWTRDGISGINDTAASTVSEWQASGLTPTYVGTTSFTVAGDQTTDLHVGRRLKITVSGGTRYGIVASTSYSDPNTTIVVILDSGTLDSGISEFSIGLTSASNTSVSFIKDLAADACACRISMTTAVSVTTADVTGATTVYVTPHKGNVISLYNGSIWVPYTFSELSQATTDNTKSPAAVGTSSNYDVFVWNDTGVLRATRGPAWSSATARGTGAGTTELSLVGGVLVNTVAITNGPAAQRGRYIGTIRSDGSSQINDALTLRHVWNYYNRVPRVMRVIDSTNTWTYSSATIRQANNAATNQLDFVIGWAEDAVEATCVSHTSHDAGGVIASSGIGLDATNAYAANSLVAYSSAFYAAGAVVQLVGHYKGYPGIGRHYLAWLEAQPSADTIQTWYGDGGVTGLQSGIHGLLLG